MKSQVDDYQIGNIDRSAYLSIYLKKTLLIKLSVHENISCKLRILFYSLLLTKNMMRDFMKAAELFLWKNMQTWNHAMIIIPSLLFRIYIYIHEYTRVEDCINQIKTKKKKDRHRPWLDPKQGSSSIDDDNSMKR